MIVEFLASDERESMSYYNYGELIRKRREELELTQEDLSDGLCSVATLSRIENGGQMPSREHYKALRERLGLSYDLVSLGVDYKSIRLVNLKNYIRDLVCQMRLDELEEPLRELKELSDEIVLNSIDHQFIQIIDTIIRRETTDPEERRRLYLDALRKTCPNIGKHNFPKVITIDEAFGLLCVFSCDAELGKTDFAIKHLKMLDRYYEDDFYDRRSTFYIRHLIVGLLARLYQSIGNVDQSINFCNLGIKQAKDSGFCGILSNFLLCRAEMLKARNNYGDIEAAEEDEKNAIALRIILKK